MEIVIIEDEKLTAEDLKDVIIEVSPESCVIQILSSVEEAVHYFQKNKRFDLIFSDIQLGDGLSFEIFKRVSVDAPIIFCTAFDEYALSAFHTNGIYYILKPFNENTIAEAIEKFKHLKFTFQDESHSYQKVIDLLQQNTTSKETSLLVFKGNRIVPIKMNQVALYYIENGITKLKTFDNNSYHVQKTLNEIQRLCNHRFYRANRQFIIHRDAIKEVGDSLGRRVIVYLTIPFQEEIVVSKENKTEFLNWLTEN